MPKGLKFCLLLFSLTILCGCDFAGPAYPKKNGPKFLVENGYSSSVVDAVKNGKKLTPELVIKLSKVKNSDVRFLVASNRHLTEEQINLFLNDKNDFARSGTATNSNLTKEQMLTIMNDRSHTVYSKLAGNPSVPENLLLKLHKKEKLTLLWFSMNPNCPEIIKKKIHNSNDELAKKWLQIINDWKKNGTYLKGTDGRWKKI